jgi:hypothetical protein
LNVFYLSLTFKQKVPVPSKASLLPVHCSEDIRHQRVCQSRAATNSFVPHAVDKIQRVHAMHIIIILIIYL